jgi:SWIM zinc finger
MQPTNTQLELLEEFIEDDFSNTILTRGKAAIKNIKTMDFIDGKFCAAVKGSSSEVYRVEIEIDEKEKFVDGECTCPYFENEFENCKHIAAVALQLIHNLKLTVTPKQKVKNLVQAKIVQLASTLQSKNKEPLPIISMEYKLEKLPDYWSIRNLTNNAQQAQNILSNYYQYPIKESNNGKRFDMGDNKTSIKTYIEKALPRHYLNVGCNCSFLKHCNLAIIFGGYY